MTATTTQTVVQGKGFHIVLSAYVHSHGDPVANLMSLDEAGDEAALLAFKTKSAATKRADYENLFCGNHGIADVRFEVREFKIGGRTFFVVVGVHLWTEPEQAPAAVPCVDCGEVVDIEATVNPTHGHAVCPKTTSRHMTGHRVPRTAVEALKKRQRWEAHQAATSTSCKHCGAAGHHAGEQASTVRPATEEETEAWLSGHLAIDGAVETEHGLLVPQSITTPKEA